jgi:hypothetical protein
MPIKTRSAKSRNLEGQTVLFGMGALEPNKKKRADPELEQQIELFDFLDEQVKRYPNLFWVHCSLNGVALTPGTMRKATRQGMRSGIWDICIPAARQGFHGCYIEMKWGRNKLTENQEKYKVYLDSENYKTAVAYNWVDAAWLICDYLGIRDAPINQILAVSRKASIQYATPLPTPEERGS